jgi:hypothetical protein
MGLLDRLFGFAESDAQCPADEALERLVDSVNPRLRLAARYREKLRPGVDAALDFARRFVGALPPAREASAARWGADPGLRAFFAAAADVPVILGRSQELRAYLDGNPGLDEAYALLRMDYGERRILGMALAGDTVQQDVAQTTANFTGHRMRVFGSSEQALRDNVERRAFDQLSLLALARLGEAQAGRTRLEAERCLLTSRLRLLQQGGVGLAPVLTDEGDLPLATDQIELELECNARELQAGGYGAARLDFEVGCVANALTMLPAQVSVERCRRRLNSMNVIVDAGAADPGHEIEFALVRVSDSQAGSHAFAPVRVARGEPRAPPPLAEALRNIVL